MVTNLGMLGEGVGLGLGLGLGVRSGMYDALKSCVMPARFLSIKSLGQPRKSRCSLNLCRVE